VNIEIKSFPERPPGLVQAVLDVITETKTADRVLLSSFDHHAMARIPSLITPRCPELHAIPRGILVPFPLCSPAAYLRGIVRAQTYHASAESLGAGSIRYRVCPSPGALWADEISELKAAGVPILVHTVNDHRAGGLADHLARIGVDGLFTDNPTGM